MRIAMTKQFFRCSNQRFTDLHDSYICSFEYDDDRQHTVPGDSCTIVLSPNGTVHCYDNGRVDGIAGDFTVLLQDVPFGPAIRIPVLGGRLVSNRKLWQIDDLRLNAEIVKLVENGALVRIGDTIGFLPSSQFPMNAVDLHVGHRFVCEVIRNDGNHPVVVSPCENE